MADAKVSISFPITIQRTSQVNHGYFTNSPLEGFVYGSEGQIKNKLKKLATTQINEALADQKQRAGKVLGCGDGTVFVVFFRMGTWHAGIYGPGRVHGGYTVGGKDLESVVEATKKHAADVFGGVAWETCL